MLLQCGLVHSVEHCADSVQIRKHLFLTVLLSPACAVLLIAYKVYCHVKFVNTRPACAVGICCTTSSQQWVELSLNCACDGAVDQHLHSG